MAKKLTYEFVKSKFEEKDYELLETEYLGSGKNMKYICKKHPNEVREITYDSIRSGQGCYECGLEKIKEKNSTPFSVIKKDFEDRGYELLDGQYTGRGVKMKYICEKHKDHIQSITYGNLKSGYGCKYCGAESRAKKNRVPYEDIIKNVEKDGYKLLTKEVDYKNNKTNIKLECPKGHMIEMRYNNFQQGERCEVCSGLFAKTTEQFKDEVAKLEGDCYTVLGEYKNNNTKILMKHNECEFEWKVVPKNFLINGSRCPKCNQSKGERCVDKILKQSNIIYEREYIFEDLKHKDYLRFDFVVFNDERKDNDNIKVIIEYDGEFHYLPILGKRALEKQQRLDRMKDEYCEKNNIKLLRIPYWEFDNIEEIVTKNLQC